MPNRLLPPSTGLLAQLTNPLNVTLLGSHLLSTHALWSSHLDLTFCRQIFSVFYTAAIEVAKRDGASTSGSVYGGHNALGPDEWAKAAVQGADEKSPRWRHVLLIGAVLLGFEGRDRRTLATRIRHRLESALVMAANLVLEERRTGDQIGIYSTIFVLNNTFHLLSDYERARMKHNHLLSALISATFFSNEGLQNSFFLGLTDSDVLEVEGKKFGWHSDTPSFQLVEQIPTKPLLSSFGPLSRLIAHAVENVDAPSLVLAVLEDLLTFSKATHVQWRQNKLSEIDVSDERQLLDEETISQSLSKLWRVLRMTLFAHVIILRAILGRLLADPFLSSNSSMFSYHNSNLLTILDAPTIATKSLHILRNLYFISSRLGETSSSQYVFVNLTAIDVLAQDRAEARGFLMAIRPHTFGQIPVHPLDRCLDLFYLNTSEHLTVVLPMNLNDELLIAAASPYLEAGGDHNLIEIFEAAHSVVLAVFATPFCTELTVKHLPFYIDALFSNFPHTLSARQFRLAFKTLIRITATPSALSASQPLLPSILLELVHERASKASVEPLPSSTTTSSTLDNTDSSRLSEQAVWILGLIDSLCFLPLPVLREWLPLTADKIQSIPDESMKNVCLERFWEALSSGEMDVERAAFCVAWWTTQGGRDRTLLSDTSVGETEQYLMSGALGLDSKL